MARIASPRRLAACCLAGSIAAAVPCAAQDDGSAAPIPPGATGKTLAIGGEVLEIRGETRELVGLGRDTAGEARAIEARVTDVAGALRDLGAKVTATEIRIELSADVLFDFDKADLRPDAVEALGKAGAIIQAHPGRPVTIDGHTDAKGSDSYNQKLSESRAASVSDWLVENAGVDRARLKARGLGEAQPIAPNQRPDGADDPAGRQKNRRVEIVIRKG